MLEDHDHDENFESFSEEELDKSTSKVSVQGDQSKEKGKGGRALSDGWLHLSDQAGKTDN